jgi:hypothetical protein
MDERGFFDRVPYVAARTTSVRSRVNGGRYSCRSFYEVLNEWRFIDRPIKSTSYSTR